MEFRSEIDAVVSMFFFNDGDAVNQGDAVMMLEIMKMTYPIEAPASGTISFSVQLGETVSAGTVLGNIT